MSEISTDRRVRRTQGSLAADLLHLLSHHDWDAISVQLICDQADVARASFYAHYPNKAALLDFLFDLNIGDVRAMIHSAPRQTGVIVTLGWLVDHIAEGREFHRKTLQSGNGQRADDADTIQDQCRVLVGRRTGDTSSPARTRNTGLYAGRQFRADQRLALKGGAETAGEMTARVTALTWRVLGAG